MRGFFLIFVTRDRCPLCSEAWPVVRRVGRLTGVAVRTVDVESDDELLSLYSLRIPVVLDPDGRVLGEGHLRVGSLVAAVVAARLRWSRGATG